MKSYTVTFTQYHTYKVEAENEWEARDKAHREFESDICRLIANPSYDKVEIECNEEYTETKFDKDGCPKFCPCKEDFPNCYCMDILDE